MQSVREVTLQLCTLYGTNDPFLIAKRKGIYVLFEPLGNIMGFFSSYKRTRFIHINCNSDQAEQRFTCAHEIGHVILHPKVNVPFLKRNTLQSIDRIEREANRFAVELLIPDELLLNGMTIYQAAAASGVPEEIAHLKSLPS
ncbi:ImmA/IrrE family metallo-endopeptidase [Paenibacillus vulneris]|uniref:ImmA/IrrE family metallo-endopeptidase n=1 Tax=Paenibacillus vulneris TaxID=1133364 RepID=A0ABW3UY03_9BACL